MIGILPVKLITFLVLLQLVSASDDKKINKTEYYESLTSQQRKEIFGTDAKDHVPDFEIVSIGFPKIHKRSLDKAFPLTIPLANKKVDLNLKLAAPLVGPNTPVYVFHTINGKAYADTTTPFKEYELNVYEDIDQLASVVIDVDADGNKYIHSGVIGTLNVSIHYAPNPGNALLQDCYIIRFIDLLLNGNHGSFGNNGVNKPTNLPVQIPSVIYPEILLLIDSSIYNKQASFHAFKNYILNFWTSVNLKYKPLVAPQYKLSIAGIAVAKDRNAFQFIQLYSTSSQLNFEGSLGALSQWLYKNRKIMPIENYDVAIVHTLLSSVGGFFSKTIGLAHVSSACASNAYEGVTKVGIIYDDNNYGSIHTAAHELGHILGAEHDDVLGCARGEHIMSAISPKGRSQGLSWSKCSLYGFAQFLRTNPSCLYNVPETYQKMLATATVATPPEIDNDIDNRIDNDLIDKKKDFDALNNFKNYRKAKAYPHVPAVKRDKFILNTDTTYSDLSSLKYLNLTLINDFQEIEINIDALPRNHILYVQILNKTDIFVFQLKKTTSEERKSHLYF